MEPSKKLIGAWRQWKRLRARGKVLEIRGRKLLKIPMDRDKFCAKAYWRLGMGMMLIGESDKLKGKANLIFAKAVISEYGNIELGWKGEDQALELHLENGLVFKP